MLSWPTLVIPTANLCYKDYIDGTNQIINNLYEYDPISDWEERLRWLQESKSIRVDRTELVRVLTAYQESVNPDPAAAEAVGRLLDPDALVVVGGQQGGLFMGPLLMIYKAISIINMAREAEKKTNRPVVPVFWIAGEDHDYDEVNHTYVLTNEPALNRIRLGAVSDKRSPISMLPIPQEEWERVIEELDKALPNSEFKPEMIERLRAASQDAATLTDACAKLLGQLFGKYGLVLLDSAMPALRAIERPMFELLIKQQDELALAVKTSEANVLAAGYPLQAEHAENSANLFFIEDGERLLLLRDGDRYADRHGKVSFTEDELLDMLEQHPERFSNNVLTRPLMQEFLFPVLGTVLGPGEIAYWAQTKQSFRALDMRMPMLWPRMSFTCVEGTLQKLLHKYDVTEEDICFRFEDKREAWLTEQDEIQLDTRFESLRKGVDEQYRDLLAVLTEALPAVAKLGDTNHMKVLEQIDYLHQRAKDAHTKQHEAGVRQWERLKLALWPQDRPQERVLNPLMYECRYGKEWFGPLLEAPVVWKGEHRIVSL
ncbi:bacillithiol biosynthesis cysteine-adding enzyme BshC [Paenibacillus marinisediminis]